MAELRWLLLLVGIGVIAAIYFYTRYKPDIEGKLRRAQLRREPILDADAPADTFPEPEKAASVSVNEQTSDHPPAVSEPRKVVAIRLMARDTAGFQADELVLLLRDKGLRHGQFGIFHRMHEDGLNEAGESAAYSVASLVEPGSFDLTRIKNDRYPGISIFMTLPGPLPGVSTFDEMMDFSRSLAQEMDGYLLDEQGGTLSVQRERYMREEIIQYEHRGSA